MQNVEMFEGTYKDIWSYCVPLENLNNFWKKNIQKVENPVRHYVIPFDAVNEILLELMGSKIITVNEEKRLRKNLLPEGYCIKNYNFKVKK